MIHFIINLINKTPFYPHWLDEGKMNRANDQILKNIHGSILEVGAGNGQKKREILSRYKNVTKYIATDYSSWDEQYNKFYKLIKRHPILLTIYNQPQRMKLDAVCSALKLPFRNDSFDYHLGFEVLEHIDDPVLYFQEAYRVVKKGGSVIISVPYLYRMHGNEPKHYFDYYRYSYGFFYYIQKKMGFRKVKIYVNTGMGTTVAAIINQWFIRKIIESKYYIKPFFLLPAIVIFPIANSIGLLIDIYPDDRFATRIHVEYIK